MTTEFENCECIAHTPKACLVYIPELIGKERDERYKGKGQFWIPKRAIHSNSEVYKADTEGALVVWDWFAEKELG